MPKQKDERFRGGATCGRGGRGGRKRQRQSDKASDVRHIDGASSRRERHNRQKNGHPGHQAQHEDDRQLPPADKTVDFTQLTGVPCPSLTGSFPNAVNSLTQMSGAQGCFPGRHRPPRSNGGQFPRGSIVTFLSTVSTEASGGCPGDQCARRNRKLRDYLTRVFKSHFEQSRRALDAWAYAAGVSVDRHMDWERTRTRPIAAGLQRGSEPCARCCAQLCETQRAAGGGDNVLLMPPDMSGMSLGGGTGASPAGLAHVYQPRMIPFPQPMSRGNTEGHMPLQPVCHHSHLHDSSNNPDDLSVPGQSATNASWAYHGRHPADLNNTAAQTQQSEDPFTPAHPDPDHYFVEDAAGNYPTPTSDGEEPAAAGMTIPEVLKPLAISEARTLCSVPFTIEDMRSMFNGARGDVVIE